jgi:DtxR family Mn-dependent transcriptional regulator
MLTGKQTQFKDLTPSHEHYLRAIYEVRGRRGYARVTDVARELGVAPPTLSVGLKPLEARGLLGHDDHRFLLLTRDGERVARDVHHRHAVVRAFLREILGLADSAADAEACLLEHDVSGRTVERLVDLLKLLREDRELGEFFQARFNDYHRACRVPPVCESCDLGCVQER